MYKFRMIPVMPGGFCTHAARPQGYTWIHEQPEALEEQIREMVDWCTTNLGFRRDDFIPRTSESEWWMFDQNNSKFFFGNERLAFLFKIRWC
jgi:hypothetical protein